MSVSINSCRFISEICCTYITFAYLNEIDLSKALVVTRLLNVEDRDDILMVEVAQQLHLSKSAEAEHRVIERRDLLYCYFLT